MGGHMTGVVPRFFDVGDVEKICDYCDELILTDTMRERKQIMEEHADAFIVTPGGIGTYEEFFEVLTLKQLCRHNKPIALYNINGFFDELCHAMEQAMKKRFIRENCLELYIVTDDLDKLFSYIEAPVGEMRSVKDLKY